MEKLILAILFVTCFITTNAQEPAKGEIELNSIAEIKAKLPKDTYMKDSSILTRKRYYLKISDDQSIILVVKKSWRRNKKIIGHFFCSCITLRYRCLVNSKVEDRLTWSGCTDCRFTFKVGDTLYHFSGIDIQL